MKLIGSIREIREFKWGGFFVLETFNGQYQCVYKNSEWKFKSESQVELTGDFQAANITKEKVNHTTEFMITSFVVLSEPTDILPFYIYDKDMKVEQYTLLENRAVSLRNEKFKSIFKIQSIIKNAFSNALIQKGFINISTPKLTAEGAEGGTNIFKLDYFGQNAFLAQSPQLYKQMCVGAFGKVYEVAPVFRAEEHDSSRHLNEYISLDVETVLTSDGVKHLIELEVNILRYIIDNLIQYCSTDFNYLNVEYPELNDYKIMTFTEVKNILGSTGSDMNGEDEIAISKYVKEKYNTDWLFITEYPTETRPFYTKGKNSFDLIYKGVEITSGSQRRENYTDLVESMISKGLKPESFKYYLDTFKFGMPLHGGFAIGLERLTAKFCDIDSTKLCSLFPRDVNRLNP
jgi:nondiscriminating aspartyl-tRNA synthetase